MNVVMTSGISCCGCGINPNISKSNIFSLDICENHCYFFNTGLVLTPCCPLGTKMPRLAQHEACGGTNGGVFFGRP